MCLQGGFVGGEPLKGLSLEKGTLPDPQCTGLRQHVRVTGIRFQLLLYACAPVQIMIRNTYIRAMKAPLALKGLWVMGLLLEPIYLPARAMKTYDDFYRLVKHRGLETAQDQFKMARWATLKLLVGDPLPKEEILRHGVPLDKHGYPKYLSQSHREELRNNPTHFSKATALLLLSIFSAETGKRSLEFSKITSPSTAEEEALKEFQRLIPTLCLMLGVSEPLRLRKPKLFATGRGGPNGHALLCCHIDAAAWVTHPGREVLESWFTSIWPKEGLGLFKRIISLGSLRLSMGSIDGKALLGRIAVKREPMKNRIFAIPDYWTQVALRPLHDSLMNVLGTIDADSTWNQDRGAERVQEWTRQGRELWSYDLSAATDRFPKTAQASLLDYLLRDYHARNLGQTWAALLTDRVYWYKTTPVRYRAGQPMGSYSSWATFALCHHMVVQWAALKTGRTVRFTDYVLLGDDIVIADGEVARFYLSLMTRLGVSVNRSKSVHSKGGAEFAKRTYHLGEELTMFTHWNLFNLAANSMVQFFALCKELTRRGTPVQLGGVLDVVLGPSSNRTVGERVHSLLLALTEPGGPVETYHVWREAPGSTSSLVRDWFSLVGESGISPGLPRVGSPPEKDNQDRSHDEERLELSSGVARLKRQASTGRLVMQGYEMAKTLLESLSYHPTAGQLQDAEARFKEGKFHGEIHRGCDLTREQILTLNEVHPAREVLEEGLNPLEYSNVPQQLRVLSTSDCAELLKARDTVRHAAARREGVIYEYNSLKELFF